MTRRAYAIEIICPECSKTFDWWGGPKPTRCRKCRRAYEVKRYNSSPAAAATRQRYRESVKGKATERAAIGRKMQSGSYAKYLADTDSIRDPDEQLREELRDSGLL